MSRAQARTRKNGGVNNHTANVVYISFTLMLYNNMSYKANKLSRKNEQCFLAVKVLYCFSFKKNSVYSACSVCLHNICLAVFTTAVRSSRRHQQYKSGLMEEFINTPVIANSHSLCHSFMASPSRVNTT